MAYVPVPKDLSKEDGAVTVRDRDTMQQERIKIDDQFISDCFSFMWYIFYNVS